MATHSILRARGISQRMRLSLKKTLVGAALLGLAGVTPPPVFAAADSPTVTTASGGNGVPVIVAQGTFLNVDSIGYTMTEYFVAGKAHSYTSRKKLTADGKWDSVKAVAKTADYETRAIVFAPKDPKKFDGTVYVEWLNVSGQADASPDWVHGHLEVARQGAIYVLASAQAVGIKTLKAKNPWWVPKVPYPVSDPVRYASLEHPGDSYSYDIFSQIGQAVHDGTLLSGLTAQQVIGVGESQSALRLTTYINGVQKLVNVYDGFLVHSSFGQGTSLSQSPQKTVRTVASQIRDDLVPVLLFETELDVSAGQLQTRQPESPSGKFRNWEVAGTAHYDTYGLDIGPYDVGDGQGEVQALNYFSTPNADPNPGIMECASGINDGPMHWVFNAALHDLNEWVSDGVAPPIAERLQATSKPGRAVVYAKDELGNTLGGIRTPFVDAPLAVLAGTGNKRAPGAPVLSLFCGLFGYTVPFTDDVLATLYPSHDVFVEKFTGATDSAVQAGFMMQEDAGKLVGAASNLAIGN